MLRQWRWRHCLIVGSFQLTAGYTLKQKLPNRLPATHKPIFWMHFCWSTLCPVLSWACLINIAKWCCLGYKTGGFLLYDMSALTSLPPHLHTSYLSQNNCSWDIHNSNFAFLYQMLLAVGNPGHFLAKIVQSMEQLHLVRDWKQRTNFCTYTAALSSLGSLLNRWQSITVLIVGMFADTMKLWLLTQSLPFSFTTNSCVTSISLSGCFGDNHEGPCNQDSPDCSSLAEMPREGRSAGPAHGFSSLSCEHTVSNLWSLPVPSATQP